jgi:hypothetical protein
VPNAPAISAVRSSSPSLTELNSRYEIVFSGIYLVFEISVKKKKLPARSVADTTVFAVW